MTQLSRNSVMLVMDCENLFKSARYIYGSDVNVDYKKITDLMILRLSHVIDVKINSLNICKIAFTSIKPNQHTQMDFLCFLSSLDYVVKASVAYVDTEEHVLRKKEDYFDWIADEVLSMHKSMQFPERVFIACGSSRLKPLYRALQKLSVLIEIFGFDGSISTHVFGVIKHKLDVGFLVD